MHCSEFSFVLKPSPVGGVGVFATHDIPAGTEIFPQHLEFRVLKIDEVAPSLRPYCVYIDDEMCIAPARFDRMEIGWYMNHSETPNIGGKNLAQDGDTVTNMKQLVVFALRPIKAGEEILIDYNYLLEPENLKEDYYRPFARREASLLTL